MTNKLLTPDDLLEAACYIRQNTVTQVKNLKLSFFGKKEKKSTLTSVTASKSSSPTPKNRKDPGIAILDKIGKEGWKAVRKLSEE
jgi:hypothetical protein